MPALHVRRVAIIGAGAMGSSLAAIVSHFADPILICRNPERAAQIFNVGVRLDGAITAETRPLVVRRIEDLRRIGGVGLVFIATKTTAIESVCHDLRPHLDDITEAEGRPVSVISYQNGIDPGRQIMDLLETRRVLRMVLHYGAMLDPDTGVTHIGFHEPPHHIGCVNDELAEQCSAIAGALTEAGFETHVAPDIELEVWRKSIINACMSPVAALINGSIGQVLESPSRAVVEHLLDEACAVARAGGIALSDDFPQFAMNVYEQGAAHTPSMVEDIRRGRESEVGQLNRQIVRRAERVKIAAPVHETIDNLIETFDWQVYQHRHQAGSGA